MTYSAKLSARIAATGSNLCVGIDPRPDQIEGDLEAFVLRLAESTEPFAAAFKPNIAYFEALGSRGYAVLERLLSEIPDEIPVILDAKRGDIGATQEYYAKAYFETLPHIDAVTISPYMGFDSVAPMLRHPGKAAYLLAVTSNPSAADLETQPLASGRQVFELVGDMAATAAPLPGELGFVVGLTNAAPEVLAKVPDSPLLLPGLGAQGGDLAALRGAGRQAPALINVSRGVMFGDGSAAERAESYRDQIAAALGRA